MKIDWILVATDLSAQGSAAVQRAWQLAHAHGAGLQMAYLPARSRDLPDFVAQARGADLVVLPWRHEGPFAGWLGAASVARLLREVRRPVLVTRIAGDAAYRRVLVAVDFSPRSPGLVRDAARLAPGAEVQLFHAVSTRDEARLRAAEATDQAVRAYWRRCVEHARGRMRMLLDATGAGGQRFATALGRGDPARQAVLQQQRSGADLVVVGKAHTAAWRDLLAGSVAARILRWGAGDVLVVPHGMAAETAPMALRRLARPRPAGLPATDRGP